MVIDKRHKRSDKTGMSLARAWFSTLAVGSFYFCDCIKYVEKCRPADVVSLRNYATLKLCPVASAGVIDMYHSDSKSFGRYVGKC